MNVNLKKKPAWFFERNPNGTVPILESNDGVSKYAFHLNLCSRSSINFIVYHVLPRIVW